MPVAIRIRQCERDLLGAQPQRHYYSHSASHYPSLLSASSDFIRGQNVGVSLQDTLGLERRIFGRPTVHPRIRNVYELIIS